MNVLSCPLLERRQDEGIFHAEFLQADLAIFVLIQSFPKISWLELEVMPSAITAECLLHERVSISRERSSHCPDLVAICLNEMLNEEFPCVLFPLEGVDLPLMLSLRYDCRHALEGVRHPRARCQAMLRRKLQRLPFNFLQAFLVVDVLLCSQLFPMHQLANLDLVHLAGPHLLIAFEKHDVLPFDKAFLEVIATAEYVF
mmetsp:Transcript_82855/g.130571  ORF Transcript_82855/g.130571 Transcript_82855/m.130571 type:complete len:200 (-) Transcript_82855:1039-1638(-)